MQVPTWATGYEEEARAAATGHEEAQATAIDQEKKPPATGDCKDYDNYYYHYYYGFFLILVALPLPLTLVSIIHGSEFLKKSLKKQSH